MKNYELVVGLEVHVQLSTSSKLFCEAATAFGAPPNSRVTPVSLALPGALPVLNKEAVTKAIAFGCAVNSAIAPHLQFERKNYFYPDLPKGYQITQNEFPICTGGSLPVRRMKGDVVHIQIHHAHLEEDAGKSVHDVLEHHTAIDLNRAGVPLLEVVTEPVIHTAEDAAAYFAELRRLVRAIGICDGNMEEGSLRCDANVSVRLKGTQKLGVRTEIKNLNSVKFLQKAIEYEAARHIALLEAGGVLEQETRGFRPETGETYSMRSKEWAHDYRYFTDPDLPPISIAREWVEEVKNSLGELPFQKESRYVNEHGLLLSEAAFITSDVELTTVFEQLATAMGDFKKAAHWLLGPVLAHVNATQSTLASVPVQSVVAMQSLINEGRISASAAAEKLLPLIFEQPSADVHKLFEQHGLEQTTDTDDIREEAQKVLLLWPDKVKAYQKGNKGLLGLFMGELMKRTGGRVNPKLASEILQEMLGR